jgi:hypothetical protein
VSAPPFRVALEADEREPTASAVRLFIADEAHHPEVRRLGREVLEELQAEPPAGERLTLTLTPGQIKVTHGAVRLLLNDLQREQADEREVLWRVLSKLPDEHTIRAITIE